MGQKVYQVNIPNIITTLLAEWMIGTWLDELVFFLFLTKNTVKSGQSGSSYSQTTQCCSFVFTCFSVTFQVRGALLLCCVTNRNAITSRRIAASTRVFKWKLFSATTFINTANSFTLEWVRFARSGNHSVILTKDDFYTFPHGFYANVLFASRRENLDYKRCLFR